MENAQKLSSSAPFSVKEYGSLDSWSAFQLPHPRFGMVPGKQFLRSELGLTGIELSLNSLSPGKALSYLHAHRQNEELYLFLTGEGQMLLDGEVVPVKAGTAIRVAPKVMRSWRNTGTEQLTCVVIQAREGSLQQATTADGFMSESAPVSPCGLSTSIACRTKSEEGPGKGPLARRSPSTQLVSYAFVASTIETSAVSLSNS
ncbi:MAG: cupin domain-containing protein [Polyangiaceae bacterium]